MHQIPEKLDWLKQVTIIGVGLLGGSVGMSLRRCGVTVHGYSRRPESCDIAIRVGAINRGFADLTEACQDSDVVVIASPVDRIAPLSGQVAQCVNPETVITDVGSTKAMIVDQVNQDSEVAKRFVAAHPIAGSEKSGVEYATASLFDGKCVIITPDSATSQQHLSRAEQFWQLVGGVTVNMSPEEHDHCLASVSHLPHLVSSLLASNTNPKSAPLVGSGWKDMTRVAAGDPDMWTAICQHNRMAILDQVDRFSNQLQQLRDLLASGNDEQLQAWLQAAKDTKLQIG